MKYIGIERDRYHSFWNKESIEIINNAYPCEISISFDKAKTLAVSNLCYGYFIHEYDLLAKQFDTVILNNILDKKEIEKFFSITREEYTVSAGYCDAGNKEKVFVLTKSK